MSASRSADRERLSGQETYAPADIREGRGHDFVTLGVWSKQRRVEPGGGFRFDSEWILPTRRERVPLRRPRASGRAGDLRARLWSKQWRVEPGGDFRFDTEWILRDPA